MDGLDYLWSATFTFEMDLTFFNRKTHGFFATILKKTGFLLFFQRKVKKRKFLGIFGLEDPEDVIKICILREPWVFMGKKKDTYAHHHIT